MDVILLHTILKELNIGKDSNLYYDVASLIKGLDNFKPFEKDVVDNIVSVLESKSNVNIKILDYLKPDKTSNILKTHYFNEKIYILDIIKEEYPPVCFVLLKHSFGIDVVKIKNHKDDYLLIFEDGNMVSKVNSLEDLNILGVVKVIINNKLRETNE